jgi:hypothetical protein
MENRKDIGKAISDKLSFLDKAPRDQVWLGINEELDKKKKKRIFFFWMLFTAVAVGTISTSIYFQESNSVKPTTNSVGSPGATTIYHNNTNTNTNSSKEKNPNNLNERTNAVSQFADEENSKSEYNINSNSNKNHTVNRKNSLTKNDNSKVNPNSNTASAKNVDTKENSKNSTEISSKDKKQKTNLSAKWKNSNYKNGSNSNKSESSIFVENKSGKRSEKNKKANKSSESDFSSKSKKISQSNESNESDKSNESTENNTLHHDALKKANENNTSASIKDKKASFNELKKANQKKRDSIIAVKITEKENKDLAVEKPKEEEKDTTTTLVTEENYEIIVAPYFGYNYTGNLGNGNFLNRSKTTKKTSQLNSSYGVLLRIMGSKKIGLQLGVGIINSNYSDTFLKESNSFIKENDVSLNVTLQELNVFFPDSKEVTSRQESTFIEVPLEAYYVISDKKLGLATTFGISFLKLQKNNVFLESDSIERMRIGSLKNISPFSSSINLKLNLFYKIFPKLQFDLYPSFQYQFMGWKDVPNYHPYFFSIKTGLSYKL